MRLTLKLLILLPKSSLLRIITSCEIYGIQYWNLDFFPKQNQHFNYRHTHTHTCVRVCVCIIFCFFIQQSTVKFLHDLQICVPYIIMPFYFLSNIKNKWANNSNEVNNYLYTTMKSKTWSILKDMYNSSNVRVLYLCVILDHGIRILL